MPDNLINDSALKIAHFLKKQRNSYLDNKPIQSHEDQLFHQLVDVAGTNPWFTKEFIIKGLDILNEDLELIPFKSNIGLSNTQSSKKKIGFITNSSRPFEDFSEIIFIALLGFECLVQLKDDNRILFRRFFELIRDFDLNISEQDNFSNTSNFIAFSTLTDTASEYLSKYHLLNLASKGSSLIISGNENNSSLKAISETLCLFFTRSKKNVKVLFVPSDYKFDDLKPYLIEYSDLIFHHRYFNNYDYRKSVMIINRIKFIEMTPLLFTESVDQAGNISVVIISRYKDLKECYNSDLMIKYPLINLSGSDQPLSVLSAFEENLPHLIKFIKEIR